MYLFTLVSFLLVSCVPYPASGNDNLLEGEIPAMPDAVEKIARFDVSGDVTPASADEFVKNLEEACKLKPERIVIRMNSQGGDFDSAFRMARALEDASLSLGCETECLVDGDAMSAMFYILQSCKVRKATKRSALMVHGPWMGGGGSLTRARVQDLLSQLDLFTNQLASHCADRMGMDLAEFKRRIRKDWYMTPEEALRAGALDAIVDNPNTSL